MAHNSLHASEKFAFLCVIFSLGLHLAFAQTRWRTVSAINFDWNGRANVPVILDIPENGADSGDFARIRIQVPGEQQLLLKNEGGWVKFGSESASIGLRIRRFRNALRSDYVLAVNAADGRMILVLVGYSYASWPGSLDVIELPSAGLPRAVLHRGIGNPGV